MVDKWDSIAQSPGPGTQTKDAWTIYIHISISNKFTFHSCKVFCTRCLQLNFILSLHSYYRIYRQKSLKIKTRLPNKTIAGLHVTSRRRCWAVKKQKYFSPLGTELYFHVNSSRRNSIVLTPKMGALLRGCKPRIHKVVVDNQNSWIVKCRFCFTTVIYSIYGKDIKVLFKKVRGVKTFTSQLRLELSCKRQS